MFIFIRLGPTFIYDDSSLTAAAPFVLQGFVRPRALAATDDGSVVYVADACEATPEKIWIFTRSESVRSRRNTSKGDTRQQPSRNSHHIVPFIERAAKAYPTVSSYNNPVFRHAYRYFSTKGQRRIRQIDRNGSKVP